MTLDVRAYLGLLAAVGAGRLVEMRLSRRHQRHLQQLGYARERERGFAFMVMLHTGVLVAAAIEVVWARRPLIVALAAPARMLASPFGPSRSNRLWPSLGANASI